MNTFIRQSVGRNGRNLREDVISIQTRLNRWITLGRLPHVTVLAVDGICGPKTQMAIGAFQYRYVGMKDPDLRVDPNGKTLALLNTNLIETTPPQNSEPIYVDWLPHSTSESLDKEDIPYWKKRGMFWVGVGAKVGGGNLGTGDDVCVSALYNYQSPAENRFILTAHNKRLINLGVGWTAGAVITFVTGIYHPTCLNVIQQSSEDYNVALIGKWSALAKTICRIPQITRLVGAAKVHQYSTLETVSSLINCVKGYLASDDVSITEEKPQYISIEIPFGGYGFELSYSCGVTSFMVSNVRLAD